MLTDQEFCQLLSWICICGKLCCENKEITSTLVAFAHELIQFVFFTVSTCYVDQFGGFQPQHLHDPHLPLHSRMNSSSTQEKHLNCDRSIATLWHILSPEMRIKGFWHWEWIFWQRLWSNIILDYCWSMVKIRWLWFIFTEELTQY